MDIIDEMRRKVVMGMRETNPEVFDRASKNRARHALLPNKNFKPTIKNLKEDLIMNNLPKMPPMPAAPGGQPTMPPAPGAPTAPATGGTGISARMGDEILRLALETSIRFRPKAIVVDKDTADQMVIDMKAPDIVQTIQMFKTDPENIVDGPDGTPRVKRYSDLRALKDTCIRTKKDPLTYAKKNADGTIETVKHKPVVQGLVVTFPGTEGQGDVTSIIKKAEFFNEITARGGAQVVGDFDETRLDLSKYEIPVVLQIKPYQKKDKDNKTISSERLTGQVSKTRKEQWFPDSRVVALRSIFEKFPVEGYELERVIPRRIHKTITVGNQEIAVVAIDTSKDAKTKTLPRYEVVDNTLTPGSPGAEIAAALGIDHATIQAAFTTQKSSGGITEAETTEELIDAVIADFRKNAKSPEYNKLLSQLEQHQNFL